MFKGRHFDRSVTLLCMRRYLAYNWSLRDQEEMMAERCRPSFSAITSTVTPAWRQCSILRRSSKSIWEQVRFTSDSLPAVSS